MWCGSLSVGLELFIYPCRIECKSSDLTGIVYWRLKKKYIKNFWKFVWTYIAESLDTNFICSKLWVMQWLMIVHFY